MPTAIPLALSALRSCRAALRALPRVLCRALEAALLACALCSAQAASAQASLANLLGGAGLLAQLYPDAACAEERVVGQCFCAGLPCGLRIERYVPVAFIETTRAPGDSLLEPLALPANPPGPTVSSSLSATDNTSEAHVWSLPGGPLPGLGCLTCTAASAASPVLRAPAQDLACGSAAAIVQEIASLTGRFAVPWQPSLSYASEIDALNWRTGCRDRLLPTGDWLAGALHCASSGAVGLSGAANGCLGLWGPLMPRQMRDIGPGPLLYSAKTAVRAMSIARDQLAAFSYPVDSGGKLQQAYPAVSACFRVGSLPLPQLPAAARPALVSPDGRYGWIYWRPSSCCVGFGAARQCLRLH
jgi:hypothetical protein